MVPPAGIAELHMDPRDPVPSDSAHACWASCPRGRSTDLVAAAGPDSGSALISVELRHTGGALARAGAGHGAVATLPGHFASFAVGLADRAAGGEDRARTSPGWRRRWRPTRPASTSISPSSRTRAESFFEPAVADRLLAVKDAYDPERLFHANHEIGAGR